MGDQQVSSLSQVNNALKLVLEDLQNVDGVLSIERLIGKAANNKQKIKNNNECEEKQQEQQRNSWCNSDDVGYDYYDFKVVITLPFNKFNEWEEKGFLPERYFLDELVSSKLSLGKQYLRDNTICDNTEQEEDECSNQHDSRNGISNIETQTYTIAKFE